MTRLLASALAAVCTFALTGCNSLPQLDGAYVGPFYTPANVHGSVRLPTELRRIVILPSAADGPALSESTLDAIDSALRTTLTQAARAEISPLSRDVLGQLAGRRQVVSTSLLPSNFTAFLAEKTGADAVLFVDITAYSPYPPLVLGLRAKLIDLKTGDIIWAFDNLFSAADEKVANSARRYLLVSKGTTGTPADLSYTVLQNPARFANYAAAAAWTTLPPREALPSK